MLCFGSWFSTNRNRDRLLGTRKAGLRMETELRFKGQFYNLDYHIIFLKLVLGVCNLLPIQMTLIKNTVFAQLLLLMHRRQITEPAPCDFSADRARSPKVLWPWALQPRGGGSREANVYPNLPLMSTDLKIFQVLKKI